MRHRYPGRCPRPVASLVRGALAGVAGTAAMDLAQYLRYRAKGGKDGLVHYEFAAVESFETAPAPAKVAKRLVEGLFQTELSDDTVNLANNVMHWGYGVAWAGAFGLVAGSRRPTKWSWGPLFGTAVFLSDYVVLPPTGLYQPIWAYDAKTLGKDWADHVVYGSVAGLVLRTLRGR